MSKFTIGLEGVDRLLKGLKVHKAAGPDMIRPRILKELHSDIAPIMQVIFQSSLSSGVVPDDWKHANVVPIYKKGPKQLAENYRPVSLTCISSKLMEHLITSQIMIHFTTHNILHDRQHGFRTGRSCETQLIEFIQDVQRMANRGVQTDAIVLDFSKAFDKVSHNKLIFKLRQYGINAETLSWVSSFLSSRTQCVVVEGDSSSSTPVLSGVPQGSVLGPTLFLAYINDLPDCVNSEVRLFADDTIIYRHITNAADQHNLQVDLQKLESWEQDWDMEFHPGKCQVIQFFKPTKLPPLSYVLHGTTLNTVDSVKYLGITLTSNLSWGDHIGAVTSKASRSLGFLRRNLRVNAPSIKEKAYMGLVRPLVEYGSTVWDPHQKYLTHRVEMVQRRAARWVLNRNHNTSSVTDMLTNLGWQTLALRRQDARVCMMYRMVHGLVATDPYLYVTPVIRQNRSTHPYSLIQLPVRTEGYRHSFFPRTVVLWNALPATVVCASTLASFKGGLLGTGTTSPLY